MEDEQKRTNTLNLGIAKLYEKILHYFVNDFMRRNGYERKPSFQRTTYYKWLLGIFKFLSKLIDEDMK